MGAAYRKDPHVRLTQAQLDTLRASVACLGCGARRVGRTGGRTTISHKRHCRVRVIGEHEERREALRAAMAKHGGSAA